jgi:hypothetical protein
MKQKRIQAKQFIFMQYFNPDYWYWEDEKITLFDDWQENKQVIFQEIYKAIKEMKGFKELALIVHDKDKKFKNILKPPHIHGYIAFENKIDLTRLARRLGIASQYVEVAKGKKYAELNNKAYLIHAKDLDKYQYLPTEVETFGTFDYVTFYEDCQEDLKKRAATVKRENSNVSLDYILQKVQKGELAKRDLMIDDDLAFLYANNMTRFREALDFYGERIAWLRLEELRQEKYKMTVLYIQGTPGVGKTYLANKMALKIKEHGESLGFKSDIYSASSKNPFDDYFGQDIIILDDLRPESLPSSDWLKVFDPLNSANMSARYKNKLVVPRIIIVANYETPEVFYSKIKGEDTNQFIRRLTAKISIQSKQFPRFEFDNLYNLSEIIKSDKARNLRISEDEYVTLNFDFKTIIERNDDKEKFIKLALDEYIFPRVFPRNKIN